MMHDEDYVKYLLQGIHELNYLLDAASARAERAEAERDRLRAVLSDIKTASVCSVSRHVAASALGEAAE